MENGDLKHKATYLLDGCLSYFLLKSVELSQSWEIVDGTVKLSCRQSLILVLPLLLKLIFKVTVLIVHRKKYIPNAQCCFLKIFFPWTLNIEHFPKIILNDGLPRWCSGEESTCHLQEVQEKWIWSLDWEDALEKEMATHSSILAWKVPWTEEPSRQFIGLQRVGHNWETACTHTHTHTHLKWYPQNFSFITASSGSVLLAQLASPILVGWQAWGIGMLGLRFQMCCCFVVWHLR